jgi:hypothetical protein
MVLSSEVRPCCDRTWTYGCVFSYFFLFSRIVFCSKTFQRAREEFSIRTLQFSTAHVARCIALLRSKLHRRLMSRFWSTSTFLSTRKEKTKRQQNIQHTFPFFIAERANSSTPIAQKNVRFGTATSMQLMHFGSLNFRILDKRFAGRTKA